MITMDFLKGVLCGEKLLLKLREVTIINTLPKFPEIDTKLIWQEVKNHPVVSKYFANSFVNLKRIPNRTFLFTVKLKGTFHSLY